MFLIFLLILPGIVKSSPVIGGNDAGKVTVIDRNRIHILNPGKHPYLAYLEINVIVFEDDTNEIRDTSICSGILIAPDIILTAAHCVFDVSIKDPQIEVTVGAVHRKLGNNIQKAKVKDYIVHKDYIFPSNPINWDHYNHNDIAILWLDIEFILTKKVQIAVLAESDFDMDEQIGVIAGWGQTANGRSSDLLQEGTLRIISNDICSIAHKPALITNSMLCAISDNKETIQGIGDSGGPIVVNGVVVGIASWAESKDVCVEGEFTKSCDPRYPGVFTRVSEFLKWIKHNVKLGPPKRRTPDKLSEMSSRIIKTSKTLSRKSSFSGSEHLTNVKHPSAVADCKSKRNSKSCIIL